MKKLLGIIAVLAGAMLVITACGGSKTPEPAPTPTPEQESRGSGSLPAPPASLPGGWQLQEAPSADPLPAEVRETFTKAMEGYVGMDFEPVAYLGSQVVAGTNYQILCLGTTVTAVPVTAYKVVTIYKDLEGNATVSNVADFDIGAVEEMKDAQAQTEQLAGGWTAPEVHEEAVLPEDAKEAFEKATSSLKGATYIPETLLGTKVIAGAEYAFLCHTEGVNGEPVHHAVIFVAANADGSYEVLNITPINPADYNRGED